jgi:hypothetical protein
MVQMVDQRNLMVCKEFKAPIDIVIRKVHVAQQFLSVLPSSKLGIGKENTTEYQHLEDAIVIKIGFGVPAPVVDEVIDFQFMIDL